MAAVLGFDKYKGPLEVWGHKVHGVQTDSNIAMRAGHWIEPFISMEYGIATGRNVADPGDYTVFVHPELSFIGTTVDRLIERELSGDAGPLEMKNNSYGSPSTWVDDVPSYRAQLQVQIACCGASWGALAGLIRCSELVHQDFDRDEEFLQAIYPKLEEFWWHVESKVPPPDVTRFALPAAKKLWPNSDGNTVLLSKNAVEAFEERETTMSDMKSLSEKKSVLEAQIRVELGDATFGDLGDGSYIKKIKAGKNGTRLTRWWPKK